jgi:hypothetical protein
MKIQLEIKHIYLFIFAHIFYTAAWRYTTEYWQWPFNFLVYFLLVFTSKIKITIL